MGWDRLLQSEALLLRSLEAISGARGGLDDADDFRAAAGRSTDMRRRVAEWARLQARSQGLAAQLERWRDGLSLVSTAAGALIVVAMALSVATVALPDDRRILVAYALSAALGVPTLALLLWLCSFVVPSHTLLGGGFGLALRTALYWRLRPQSRARHLADAAKALLSEHRLGPWMFGLVNHGLWSLVLPVAAAVIWLGYMFRAYQFGWETTVLDSHFFVALVRWTGAWAPPLGLALPSSETVGAGWTAAHGQDLWARWLIGCLLVWGWLPRVLAWAVCRRVVARRLDRIDGQALARPFVQDLLQRFEAWDERVRAEQLPSQQAADSRPVSATEAAPPPRQGAVLIGWELADDLDLPPVLSSQAWRWSERLPGRLEERESVIDRVAQTRPAQVLVVCDATQSPDLGTERLLRSLLDQGAAVSLGGLGADPTGRWPRWLAARQLSAVRWLQPESLAAQGFDEVGA